jgi:hypothetical protein
MGANKMKLGEKVLVIGGEYHGRLGTFIDNYPMTQRLQDVTVPYARIVIKPEGEVILPASQLECCNILMPPHRLLNAVYNAVSQNLIEVASDLIMQHLDEWMLRDEFDQCDAFLTTVDLERLEPYTIVVVLAVTVCAKDKLFFRKQFVERVETQLKALVPDRAEKLMEGLR